MAEPGLQASSRDAISGVISGAVSVSSTLVAEASLADQIWYELNRPPVTLNPFEVSPVGYVFVAMYASYLGWQIFRPASEAEIEIEAKRQAAAEEAARSSVGFLQEAAAEENAKVLPSGLVYTQLSEGTGAMPTASQTVKVHYEGKLADGTVFDSSIRRGEPTEFKVEQVIQGWQEGLQLMREGGKARLTIPASLAYGSYGSRTIPGNAALQFEVELLEVRDEGFKLPF